MAFDPYDFALLVGLTLVAVLTIARVAEVITGHRPTDDLTAGFAAAVAGVLALMGTAGKRK